MSIFDQNLLPSTIGRSLGSTELPWDAHIRNLYVQNQTTTSTQTGDAFANVMEYGADNTAGFIATAETIAGSNQLFWGQDISLTRNPPRIGQAITISQGSGTDSYFTTTIVGLQPSPSNRAILAAPAPLSSGGFNRGVAWGTDSTSAIQAAIDYVQSKGGGTVCFPPGQYIVSTVHNSAGSSATGFGRVTLLGAGGRQATKLIGIGADQTPIIKAQNIANSVPMGVEGLGFESFDSGNRRSTAIYLTGGIEHKVHDCYFGTVYNGVRCSNTFLGTIDFNRFYGCSNSGILFDSSSASAVISMWVMRNEFGSVGKWCIENTSAGGGGSNTNRYLYNDFEGTATQGGIYLKSETRPMVIGNRVEVDTHTLDGTYRAGKFESITDGIFIGNGFPGHAGGDYGLEIISNSGCIFMGNEYTTGTLGGVLITGSISPSYFYNIHVPTSLFSGTGLSSQQFITGTDGFFNSTSLKLYARTDEPSNARAVPGIEIGGRLIAVNGGAPVAGTWTRGDRVFNNTPAEAGSAGSKYVITGWICTLGGTPGTWLEMRTLTGG